MPGRLAHMFDSDLEADAAQFAVLGQRIAAAVTARDRRAVSGVGAGRSARRGACRGAGDVPAGGAGRPLRRVPASTAPPPPPPIYGTCRVRRTAGHPNGCCSAARWPTGCPPLPQHGRSGDIGLGHACGDPQGRRQHWRTTSPLTSNGLWPKRRRTSRLRQLCRSCRGRQSRRRARGCRSRGEEEPGQPDAAHLAKRSTACTASTGWLDTEAGAEIAAAIEATPAQA